MSESEKMTNHTRLILCMGDKSCCAHNRQSCNCLESALQNDGRYAFVMSLSSHFSIQIQNNCVIMNVDTNQHSAFIHSNCVSLSLCSPQRLYISRLNGDSLIVSHETLNPENMNLCTHIPISLYYVLRFMNVFVCVFCINN